MLYFLSILSLCLCADALNEALTCRPMKLEESEYIKIYPCDLNPCNSNGAGLCVAVCNRKVWTKNYPCDSNPCDVNAVCENVDDRRYTCECNLGFKGDGKTCRKLSPCDCNPCNENAICTNVSDGRYTCHCMPGYKGDGKECTRMLPCESNPCHERATCENLNYVQHICTCVKGYTGTGEDCEKITPCDGNPCDENALCENIDGERYTCFCIPGYKRDGNECTKNYPCENNPCHEHATCENLNYIEYVCTCMEGYKGSGEECEKKYPCEDNPCHENATCENLNHTYHVCTCIDGYKGTGEECRKIFISCKEILAFDPKATSGLYHINDGKNSVYRTYCDFETGGGGWTLVASVHENFMQGRCTTGDKWSSEQGYNSQHPHGDFNWENSQIFGVAESASSDDYKNPGYFNLEAKDIMIWHVPNDTPVAKYRERAFMMYHTTTGFLHSYGNLRKLFRDYFPLRDRMYDKNSGNGPSSAVDWDKGSNDFMIENTAPKARDGVIPGYVQFRVINNERAAFAICAGVKIKSGWGDVEHCCIGGTSYPGQGIKQCGDFAAKDWDGYGTGQGWSSNLQMTESVVMIFYR